MYCLQSLFTFKLYLWLWLHYCFAHCAFYLYFIEFCFYLYLEMYYFVKAATGVFFFFFFLATFFFYLSLYLFIFFLCLYCAHPWSLATRRSPSSLPRKPLAKGLFSIFNWVIYKNKEKTSFGFHEILFSLGGNCIIV